MARWMKRLIGPSAAGAGLATALMFAPGMRAAESGCVLTVDPADGRLGTEFAVTGSGFGEPTVVTILFSEEEVGLTPATKVSEQEVDVDGAGRFTLRLRPTHHDEMGFWSVDAVVPETECGDGVVFHVLGPPDTATEPTGEGSTVGLLVAVAGGAAFVAAVVMRRPRSRQ